MGVFWYQNLYVGEKAEKHKEKIKRKISRRIGTIRVYLLMLSSNERNSLDIINAAVLKQPFYKGQDIRIVGIAMSYDEALEILQQIAKEVYENTNGMDIRQYICSKHKFGKWRV